MNSSDLPLALFTAEDGTTRLEIRLQDDSLWLTQRQIAALYEKSPPTINEHLKNIYEEGELKPEATIRKFRIVVREGARDVERLLDHYNLEVVLAVGYRVRSNRGTQFRQWAIHGHTAAELICERADSNKPNMGLTSWSGGWVSKKDVSVAKNYLSQDERSDLNRIVTMYLDFSEKRQIEQSREPSDFDQFVAATNAIQNKKTGPEE